MTYENIEFSEDEKDDDDEKTLDNIKADMRSINKNYEREKLFFFKSICESTKLFRIGLPGNMLREDIVDELWHELFSKRTYRVTKEGITSFIENAVDRIIKKLKVTVKVHIPLLDLPEDHPEWIRARQEAGIEGMTINIEYGTVKDDDQ